MFYVCMSAGLKTRQDFKNYHNSCPSQNNVQRETLGFPLNGNNRPEQREEVLLGGR